MDTLLIFTDAATSSEMHFAVGIYLCISTQELEAYAKYNPEELYEKINAMAVYQYYPSKKSTWSEIKVIIDSLTFVFKNKSNIDHINIYTDCQSVCDLLGRRKEHLKKSDFITRTGKVNQNADLYKKLFSIAESFHVHTFKMKGHHPKEKRITIEDKIFSIIDKLSRKKLRSILTTLS